MGNYYEVTSDGNMNFKKGANQWMNLPSMTTDERNTMISGWGTSEKGRRWYNTTLNRPEEWNGSKVIEVQFRPNRVIIVAKDGSGDFTTIKDALNSIGTDPRFPASSDTNTYMIKIMPSTDGTTTIYTEDNPIQWNKEYVHLVADTRTKVYGQNANYNIFEISTPNAVFRNIIAGFSSKPNNDVIAFKLSGDASNVCFENCSIENVDIGWQNESGDNLMRGCNCIKGTIDNFIKVLGGRFASYYSYCLSSCTILDYTFYVSGGHLYLFLFHDEAEAKIGSIYNNSSFIYLNGCNLLYATTNTLFSNGGVCIIYSTTIAYSSGIGLRVGNSGIVNGSISFNGNSTYDIQTDNGNETINIESISVNLAKTNFASGTIFSINPKTFQDQTFTNQTGIFYLLGTFQQVINSQVLNSGTPQSHTNAGNQYISITVSALTSAGIIRLSGTSYNPISGTTTPADTEDITVSATGSFMSTKLWTGTVTLSAIDGFNGTISTWRDYGFKNDEHRFILNSFVWEFLDTTGGNNHRLVITKWNKTSGYTNMYDNTITSVANINLSYSRINLKDIFDVLNGERLYVWITSGSTSLRRIRYRIVFSSER